ncbi:hypothetical protein ACQPXM_10670 [Kribbella sp. CA-253562]|uniref:hypothetical protein n=1 Tax=Kribbella sp. CA-253562 TaxID=3239942 RepID=UPI003D94598C
MLSSSPGTQPSSRSYFPTVNPFAATCWIRSIVPSTWLRDLPSPYVESRAAAQSAQARSAASFAGPISRSSRGPC